MLIDTGGLVDAASSSSCPKLTSLRARQGPEDVNDALLEADISKVPIPLPEDPDKWLKEHPDMAKDPAVSLINEVDNPFTWNEPSSTEKGPTIGGNIQHSSSGAALGPFNGSGFPSQDKPQLAIEQTQKATTTHTTTQASASASVTPGILPWLDGTGCKDVAEHCVGTDEWCVNHFQSAGNDNIYQCFEKRGFFLRAFEDAITNALGSEAEKAVFQAISAIALDTGVRELSKEDGTQVSAKNAAESAVQVFLQVAFHDLEASVSKGVDRALERYSSH